MIRCSTLLARSYAEEWVKGLKLQRDSKSPAIFTNVFGSEAEKRFVQDLVLALYLNEDACNPGPPEAALKGKRDEVEQAALSGLRKRGHKMLWV